MNAVVEFPLLFLFVKEENPLVSLKEELTNAYKKNESILLTFICECLYFFHHKKKKLMIAIKRSRMNEKKWGEEGKIKKEKFAVGILSR